MSGSDLFVVNSSDVSASSPSMSCGKNKPKGCAKKFFTFECKEGLDSTMSDEKEDESDDMEEKSQAEIEEDEEEEDSGDGADSEEEEKEDNKTSLTTRTPSGAILSFIRNKMHYREIGHCHGRDEPSCSKCKRCKDQGGGKRKGQRTRCAMHSTKRSGKSLSDYLKLELDLNRIEADMRLARSKMTLYNNRMIVLAKSGGQKCKKSQPDEPIRGYEILLSTVLNMEAERSRIAKMSKKKKLWPDNKSVHERLDKFYRDQIVQFSKEFHKEMVGKDKEFTDILGLNK
jgi:hypothetical protein